MMKKLLLPLLCLLPFALSAMTIKDKLARAQTGDFVVTEQNKIYSILLVRNVSPTSIQFEEVSVPQNKINLKETSWKTWLDQKSPGHSSWMTYEIDFVQEALTEGYSFSQKQWLHLDESEYLLAKLLTLPLKKVPLSKQRKIGPPPRGDEADRRVVWVPPMAVNGQKQKNPKFDVYEGKWPKDDSYLSECTIVLYFDASNPEFPFPYWLEVSNGHYTFKLKTLDSGTGLQTQFTQVSLKPYCRFIKPIEQQKRSFILSVQSSANIKEFAVFAEDKTEKSTGRIAVPFKVKTSPRKGLYHLEIPKKSLKPLLTADHTYRLVLMPKKHPDIVLIAEDAFVWKP